MAFGYGKVVGGHFMNATITTNRKGELSLQPVGVAAFKKRPTLTADAVASWEEIISEKRGGAVGAVGAVSKVARAALPGVTGKAAQRQSIQRGQGSTPFELTGLTESNL